MSSFYFFDDLFFPQFSYGLDFGLFDEFFFELCLEELFFEKGDGLFRFMCLFYHDVEFIFHSFLVHLIQPNIFDPRGVQRIQFPSAFFGSGFVHF